MILPLFTALFTLLLVSATNAADQQQKALKDTQTQELNPTITASVKSIFSSLSSLGSTTDPTSETACCDATCALGLCNGFYGSAPTPAPDAARTLTAPPGAVTKRPWRPDVPIGCNGRGCTQPTGRRWSAWWPIGCNGRDCSAPTGQTLWKISTIFPNSLTTTQQEAKPTGGSSSDPNSDDDPAQAFHAAELAGHDQDTLPIIVETSSEDPVTLLADIDLTLMENYISSGMLEALGISSTSSQLVAIAKKDQRAATLGTEALKVTPHARISLDFLTGPEDALKQFADVDFNVFDLPSVSKDGTVTWEPEVFLGLAVLRDAAALKLTDDFAGHGALDGLPVLVRGMKGFELSSNQARTGNKRQEGWEKDEL